MVRHLLVGGGSVLVLTFLPPPFAGIEVGGSSSLGRGGVSQNFLHNANGDRKPIPTTEDFNLERIKDVIITEHLETLHGVCALRALV